MYKEILNTEEREQKQTLLMVNKRFLTQIVKEIDSNPKDETGGYIYGLRDSSDPKRTLLIPLESFTPLESSEVERQGAHLNIGGPIAGIYRSWQIKNWQKIYSNFYRDFSFDSESPNTKLSLLGIWHKHPGSLISYSGEDSMTVDNILQTPGKKDFLFPVAIDSREYSWGLSTPPLIPEAMRLNTGANHFIDIKFYYRSKFDGQTQILKPMIINQNIVPHLAEIPWYVQDPSRFNKELDALKNAGFNVALKLMHRQNLHFPDTWLVITHKDSKKPYYLRMSSFSFPLDGLFLITPNDPDKTVAHHEGFVLNTNSTIAETIYPIIFNNNNHERTK